MEMVPATTAAFTRDAAWHFRKCGKPVFLFAWGIGDGSASAQPSRQFGPIHHEPAQTSLKRALNQLWSGIFRYKCVTIRNFGCFFKSCHIFPSPKTIRGYKSAHFQGKCLKKHTPEPKAMCHDPKFWSFFRIVTQKTSLLYPVRNQTYRNDARRTRLSAAFKDSSADRHKRGTTPRSRDHAESGRPHARTQRNRISQAA